MDKKIQILVAYHKWSELLAGEDFLPVHVGRALAKNVDSRLIENTTGDDTGDNISSLNYVYNEMTAVYWAWKNLNADYYGLMHYRRVFYFRNGDKNYYSTHTNGSLSDVAGYSGEDFRQKLAEYDFVAPKPVKKKSVYDHYKQAHDVSDLDAAIIVINEHFPEYAEACDRYLVGHDSYFYNMFVFDKVTFYRYCEFVFGVLDRIRERFEGKRMYISERLTGIFITKLIMEGKQGYFLPVLHYDVKIGLKKAVIATKANLATRTSKGIRSLIYAFKPILEQVLPRFVFKIYRNRG